MQGFLGFFSIGAVNRIVAAISYPRSLRAPFNEATANGIIKRINIILSAGVKYPIPTSRNIKKALSINHIGHIYNYVPTSESEERARAYWLFCYLSNGMNSKDVTLLKHKKYPGEYIVFERAKTERAGRTGPKLITVYMNEDIAAIIDW